MPSRIDDKAGMGSQNSPSGTDRQTKGRSYVLSFAGSP